jgi:hypothetical protein
MLTTQEAYFVETGSEYLYRLSRSKRKQLEKVHPDWNRYNCDQNEEDLKFVEKFFMEHGELIGSPKFKNLFVGLTT